MRLVEKKCPKCGADLSFDVNSKEVMCSYCKTSYEIERDVTDNLNDIFNPEFFNLQTKIVKNFTSRFVSVWTFIFIVSMLMFLIIFINVALKIFG